MHCMVCRQGETSKGVVTVPLQRRESTIIFKNVVENVCNNCGEYYLDEETTCSLLEQAEQAVQRGAEVEIIRLAGPDHRSHIVQEENVSIGSRSRVTRQ